MVAPVFRTARAPFRAAVRKGGLPYVLAITLLASFRGLAASPALPTIPPGTNNVLAFGAVGDGISTNAIAIQTAINSATTGGIGTVEIPAGTFLSGPLTF